MNRGKQIKKFLSLLLVTAILFQTFSKLGYIVNYAVNKNYIAKNLCENRGKPKMKCNGKCHLKKQLAKAEKNESQGKSDSKEKWEDLYCASAGSIVFATKELNAGFFYYQNSFSDQQEADIFHPPCV
jgi:hypothetical protein